MKKGFTLIELLVVATLFVIIGLFITQTLATILSNRQKTDTAQTVRAEAQYTINVIERHLRAAKTPVCTGSLGAGCNTACNGSTINYEDALETKTSFSCTGSNPTYMASASAHLTSDNVSLSNCSFVCTSSPDKVKVSFTVSQYPPTTDSRLNSSTDVQTEVTLRNK